MELVPEGGDNYKLEYENGHTYKEVSMILKPQEYVMEYTPDNQGPQKLTVKTNPGMEIDFELR